MLELTVSSVNRKSGPEYFRAGRRQDRDAPGHQSGLEKTGDGIWFVAGGSHNSMVVEFPTYITVIEAPLGEARSLAVIAEAKRLVPNKPIKYLINTHSHFDHSGGVRTYVAEGATIITQEINVPFYQKAWADAAHARVRTTSQRANKEATFLPVKEKYVLTRRQPHARTFPRKRLHA